MDCIEKPTSLKIIEIIIKNKVIYHFNDAENDIYNILITLVKTEIDLYQILEKLFNHRGKKIIIPNINETVTTFLKLLFTCVEHERFLTAVYHNELVCINPKIFYTMANTCNLDEVQRDRSVMNCMLRKKQVESVKKLLESIIINNFDDQVTKNKDIIEQIKKLYEEMNIIFSESALKMQIIKELNPPIKTCTNWIKIEII